MSSVYCSTYKCNRTAHGLQARHTGRPLCAQCHAAQFGSEPVKAVPLTQSTHTPTPWSLGMRTATYGKIMSDDTERPCIAHVMQMAGPDGKPDAESLANAAHIVRCVNHHDELVNALRGMLNWARRVKGLNPGMEVAEAVNVLARATQED